MPILGILTFINKINYKFWYCKPGISIYFDYFSIYKHFNKFHIQLSMKKVLQPQNQGAKIHIMFVVP